MDYGSVPEHSLTRGEDPGGRCDLYHQHVLQVDPECIPDNRKP